MRIVYHFFLFLALFVNTLDTLATVHYAVNLNDTGAGSLRYVIANADTNDTVRIHPNLLALGSDTIHLLTPIPINSSIKIIGLYNITDTIFISGGNSTLLFQFGSTLANIEKAFIDSLVLLNCAGAINVYSDSLYVRNSVIRNTNSYLTGGLSHTGQYLEVNNCTFTQCQSNYGGGIEALVSKAVIDNTKFQSCIANSGGAIRNSYLIPINLELKNCLFLNNNVASDGIITLVGPKVKLSLKDSVIFSSNTAPIRIEVSDSIHCDLDSVRFSMNTDELMYLRARNHISLNLKNFHILNNTGITFINARAPDIHFFGSSGSFLSNSGVSSGDINSCIILDARYLSSFFTPLSHNLNATLKKVSFQNNVHGSLIAGLYEPHPINNGSKLSVLIDSCDFVSTRGVELFSEDSAEVYVTNSLFDNCNPHYGNQSSPLIGVLTLKGVSSQCYFDISNCIFQNNFIPLAFESYSSGNPADLKINDCSFINNQGVSIIEVDMYGPVSYVLPSGINVQMDQVHIEGNNCGNSVITFTSGGGELHWDLDLSNILITNNYVGNTVADQAALKIKAGSYADSVSLGGSFNHVVIDSVRTSPTLNGGVGVFYEGSSGVKSNNNITFNNCSISNTSRCFNLGSKGNIDFKACQFINNSFEVIHNTWSSLNFSDSCFVSNSGNIDSQKHISFKNSIIENNQVGLSSSDSIYVDSSLFINISGLNLKADKIIGKNSVFKLGSGYAISVWGENVLQLENCEFLNLPGYSTSAIYKASLSPANWSIDQCTFHDIRGTCIDINQGSLSLNRSTFFNNSGLFQNDFIIRTGETDLSINNCTFLNNYFPKLASSPTSVSVLYAPGGLSSFSVHGSIFANQDTNEDEFYVANGDSLLASASLGYNIFQGERLGNHPDDFYQVDSNLLLFDTLANNGGFTQTVLPLSNNLAINSGDPMDNSAAQNASVVGVRDRGAAETSACGQLTSVFGSFCDSIYLSELDSVFYSSASFLDSVYSGLCDSVYWVNLQFDSTTFSSTQVQSCNNYRWNRNNTTYYQSGIYQFIDSTSSACPKEYELDLDVIQPNILNDSLANCGSFTWPFNSQTYSNSGIYTDTNFQTCQIGVLDITINDADANVNYNSNGSLSSDSTFDSYQWLMCDSGAYQSITGETQAIFVPINNGEYALAVSSNNCLDTSACVYFNSVGIPELDHIVVEVYPNPSTQGNYLNISCSKKIENINILDLSGKTVQRFNNIQGERFTTIQVNISPSLYIVQMITTEGDVFERKIAITP